MPVISHRILVPALLLLSAALALGPLVSDSTTFDETSKLTAGYSHLVTGDFRLAPEHPPLARIWAAFPLLWMDLNWTPLDHPAWIQADPFGVGRDWLFARNNGHQVMMTARMTMVALLMATCLGVYWLGRRLFGREAGLLALISAAFSPTLLGQGHLVATDLPLTLAFMLCLLSAAALAERVTPLRLAALAASLGAAATIKFSWPLVLPALAATAVHAIFRRQAPLLAGPTGPRPLRRRQTRLIVFASLALVLAISTLAAIWSAYGWRADVVARDGDNPASLESTRQIIAAKWDRAMLTDKGTPKSGLTVGAIRQAAQTGVLPGAYSLGLAQAYASTQQRSSFLMGAYSIDGRASYFPIAMLVKTPLPTLLLALVGIIALFSGATRVREPLLLTALAVFGLTYLAAALSAGINIGVRHVLPLYPVLFVLAGAAVAIARRRIGRVAIGGLVIWLVAATAWAHPHYLSYFNEAAGGPARGHRWLSDSNIDWGQDLIRLADYAQAHPHERLHLAYFGSALPAAYGIDYSPLPSYLPLEAPDALTPGTYAISLTLLQGVYHPLYRSETWLNPRIQDRYRTLIEADNGVSPALHAWQFARLISRLAGREPDERVGYSLWLYRLDETAIRQLIAPADSPAP